MIRIICRREDNQDVAGFGGVQQTEYHTFDIEEPVLEEWLREATSQDRRSVVGAELIRS